MTQLMVDRKAFRKSVKKDASFLGWGLFLYAVINFVVVIAAMVVEMIGRLIWEMVIHYRQFADEATRDMAVDKALDNIMLQIEESAISMIVSVLIGTGILFLFFFRSKIHKKLFVKKKKMTAGKFVQITFVFLGAQLVISGLFFLIEWGLNLVGLSALSNMETATMESQSVSMFLYAGIVGPVIEEILYRGYALRYLEKYGKILTITVSSLLFGFMHCNLPQDIGAVLVGVVLGYVAVEYSIGWSILLHIINNMVLGDLLSYAISGLEEQTQTIITYAIMIVLFIGGLVVLIYHRKTLIGYIKQNKPEKSVFLWVMTSVGMLVFFVSHIIMAFSLLEPFSG